MTKKRQFEYHRYFMEVAELTSKLSYARRNKVGAIIVKNNRILTHGHNGTPVGYDNNCENENSDGTLTTKDEVIHAEANALYYCAKYGISTDGATLYVTMSPCVKCAQAIIQAGIKNIFYRIKYRDTFGIEFLKKNNIKITQI